MGELIGLGLSGLLWVGIARALTSDKNPNRHALIALIAFVIPCLLFTLACFVTTAPEPLVLGLQLVSTLAWWALLGRPAVPKPAPAGDTRPFLPPVVRCRSCEGAKFCKGCGGGFGRKKAKPATAAG